MDPTTIDLPYERPFESHEGVNVKFGMLTGTFIMIDAIADAVAGHAGDTGVPGMMPHELLGGIAILAGIGLALVILLAIGIWLLIRIERRLRKFQ